MTDTTSRSAASIETFGYSQERKRRKSRRWFRDPIVPPTGFAIVADVPASMDANARTLGAAWPGAGLAIVILVKRFGGKRTPQPE